MSSLMVHQLRNLSPKFKIRNISVIPLKKFLKLKRFLAPGISNLLLNHILGEEEKIKTIIKILTT